MDEAYDISTHLKPLRKHFEDFEQLDFPEINALIPPLFHVIGLLWSHSKFYCRPARVIVLLREIGNFLIELVSKSLDTLFDAGNESIYDFTFIDRRLEIK